MKTFLGYMDSYDEQYYNFYPLYEYIDGCFIQIENVEEIYPEHGNFAIFKNRYYEIENDILKREFCIIKLDDEDIQENRKYNGEFNTSHYKIQIEDLVREQKLCPLSDYNLYPIVAPDSAVDFSNGNIITVEEQFPINNYMTKSILFHNGSYYGPFETSRREIDGQIYINPRIKNSDYVIQKYSFLDDIEDHILYCQFYKSEKKITDFIHITEKSIIEPIDVITDEELLKEYSQTISKSNFNGNITSIDDLTNSIITINNSIFTASEYESINNRREERLKSLLQRVNDFKDISDDASKLISNILINSDDENLNQLVEKIVSNPNLLNRFQSHKVFEKRIDEERDQLIELQHQKDKLLENIEAIKEESQKDALQGLNELKEEKERIEVIINEETAKLDDIKNKLHLSNQIQELTTLESHYRDRFNDLQREIDTKIHSVSTNAAKINFDDTFDKMISKKMSNALAKFDKTEEEEEYKNLSDRIINDTTYLNIDSEHLIDYVVNAVKKYRPKYSKNTIANILICISKGFLTVFSGAPGTGKTSICEILFNVLGLDSNLIPDSNIYTKRSLKIAVGRGWNSKRDLIGYYNPLSKRIEKNNSNLYDALRILHHENTNSKIPMLVLLDEANLSPMEYYWGDFVSICDSVTNGGYNTINLGETEIIKLPKTLRFLATINNDDTTETISPRLIDRAFIITLPSSAYTFSEIVPTSFLETSPPISWDVFINSINQCKTPMDDISLHIFEDIKSKFKDIQQSISPRVENYVKDYCSVAQNILEEEGYAASSIVALDYALSQKVITKINGNGESYLKWLNELKTYCESQNLKLTSDAIERIIIDGNKSMQYYHFFS